MVKYDFLGSWRSTIAETIRVGFTTTNPKGFLLGFSSNISGEYLTIMVSNSGEILSKFVSLDGENKNIGIDYRTFESGI